MRGLTAALAAMIFTTGAFAQAPSLSPAEKTYAELAALPLAERQKRLEDGARREGKLILIHAMARTEATNQANAFHARYPFVDVEVTNLGSQDAAERIVAEETAGRHLTDAAVAALPDFQDLLKSDLLARYPTPATKSVLPQYGGFVDPQNRWVPWFWSEHGLSYNTNLVPANKAPKDWFDLCDPVFKGGVSFDPAEIRYLSGLYAMWGEDRTRAFLQCIGANQPIIQRGHLQRMELMIAGDHMAQGDNYLYAGLAIKKKNPAAPYAIVFTAPVLGYGGATIINRNAPHPYASALFADWCIGEENQKWVAGLLRGPVAIPHPFLPPEVKIVAFGHAPKEVMDRLLGYWRQYVEKK